MLLKSTFLAASLLTAAITCAESEAPKHLNNKITFNIGHFGYEHLEKNGMYCAADAKFIPIFKTNSDKSNKNEYSTNAEMRMGYNFNIGSNISMITYGGIGFSLCNLRQLSFTLKEFPYIAFGAKPIYNFGPTYSMGIHIKTFKPLSMKYEIGGYSRLKDSTDFSTEFGIPCIWNLGKSNRWELQFEPYYTKLKGIETTNLFGSKATFGYKF